MGKMIHHNHKQRKFFSFILPWHLGLSSLPHPLWRCQKKNNDNDRLLEPKVSFYWYILYISLVIIYSETLCTEFEQLQWQWMASAYYIMTMTLTTMNGHHYTSPPLHQHQNEWGLRWDARYVFLCFLFYFYLIYTTIMVKFFPTTEAPDMNKTICNIAGCFWMHIF